MSGRFVSAGTAEEPPERDDDWIKAQHEIEANARRKKEEGSGLQDGGKSLYEVLQANKAAKQEAFEESVRLKNQFRSLDEDEVDFLDSVLESTRAKDEAVRKETTQQLDAFRKQQEEVEKANRSEPQDGTVFEEEEQWQVSNKKRKKRRDSENKKALKLRRTSSAGHRPSHAQGGEEYTGQADLSTTSSNDRKPDHTLLLSQSPPALSFELPSKPLDPETDEIPSSAGAKTIPITPVAGLVDYSSDDE